MSEKRLCLAISRILIDLLLFFAVITKAQNNNSPTPSCHSSCGNISNISFPFRLRGDPKFCGLKNRVVELECRNNRTLVVLNAPYFVVQEINYEMQIIRLVDPNIKRGNLSSCPLYSNRDSSQLRHTIDSSQLRHTIDPYGFDPINLFVVFIQCLNPLRSSKYVPGTQCGSNIFSNDSSEIYSYVTLGNPHISDLEESCWVNMVVPVSTRAPMRDNSSWAGIHDVLGYGFDLRWLYFSCDYTKISVANYICLLEYWGFVVASYAELVVAALLVLKFLIGFPFLIMLVIRKWRKRHLSMDETIEEFLQGHNNFTPIKYTYSEIKKMTNNFSQKLGEGGYGAVYKGQLRSGPFIAVKVMGQSISSEQEFISEVSTIGRIHHVNIVQLIGFCVKGPKCALVYEYLPNGSLDRYIFSHQGIDALALRYEKLYEIALGVARGVDYLHRGCDMQILHFDIKPHNILLDENFGPKISDFGLAKLYPSDGGSIINLTAARGTMGYMAPEMFYKNIGGVSYKADVYSFGMLLMEMAARRKNMNPFADDVGQIYFPLWAYDQLHKGNEIEITDASEEERKMVKRIILVALWCIQMKPSDRPPMIRVVEMLEGDEDLMWPPKPFVAPCEIAEDNHGMS